MDFRRALDEHLEVFSKLETLAPGVDTLAAKMSSCLASGGKICWLGNGGSAADSEHLAAELVGRFTRERRGLASIALTANTSILTAIGNDYGVDQLFARQIEALCTRRDVVIGLSTSGNSMNVIQALRRARQVGAFTAGLTGGTGGRMVREVDACLIVPSIDTARIQEAHIFIGHLLCEAVESALYFQKANGSHG